MKTQYKNIEIKEKLTDTGKLQSHIWGQNKWKQKPLRSNRFKITLKNTDTKKQGTFTFHGSHYDWENGVLSLDEEGLLHAF